MRGVIQALGITVVTLAAALLASCGETSSTGAGARAGASGIATDGGASGHSSDHGGGVSTTGGGGVSTTGGGGVSTTGGAAASAGTLNAGSGGTLSNAGSAGSAGSAGLMVDPPLAALEGIWNVSRQSPMEACGTEPTQWTGNNIFFKLAWNAQLMILEEYSCPGGTTCSQYPDALGDFRVLDGAWLAVLQDASPNGTCAWEEAHLELLASGTLRRTFGSFLINEPCGPNQLGRATCSNEWIQEAHRVSN